MYTLKSTAEPVQCWHAQTMPQTARAEHSRSCAFHNRNCSASGSVAQKAWEGSGLRCGLNLATAKHSGTYPSPLLRHIRHKRSIETHHRTTRIIGPTCYTTGRAIGGTVKLEFRRRGRGDPAASGLNDHAILRERERA